MCAGTGTVFESIVRQRMGLGQQAPKADVEFDSAGRNIYPDGTPNYHSGTDYQDSMKIGDTGGGALKGDEPLVDPNRNQGEKFGVGGGTATLNY